MDSELADINWFATVLSIAHWICRRHMYNVIIAVNLCDEVLPTFHAEVTNKQINLQREQSYGY